MHMLKQKGFTLVELLVVIAIIGLLSTIAVVSLGSARAKARDAKRAADMKQLITALEQFYNDNNGYPSVDNPGLYPALAAENDCVLGGTNSNVLSSNNTTAACTATGAIGAGTGATTTYMTIPPYPTPGKSGAATNCSASGAAYCYTANTAFTTGLSTAYTVYWQLENANSALGSGTNCTTTNSGTICS